MGLAEQMVGIKAKTFLMTSLYDMIKKYSFLSSKWPEIAFEIIHSSINKSFRPDEKRLDEHTVKFLQWLGFSPVDLKFDIERKVLVIYIGTSRIWREDPKSDKVSGVMMKGLISALGENYFNTRPSIEFLSENLPPRTQYGFKLSDQGAVSNEFGTDFPSEASVSGNEEILNSTDNKTPQEPSSGPSSSDIAKTIKKLKFFIEPILGIKVSKEDATKELFETIMLLLEEEYPDDFRNLQNEIASKNVLNFLFQKSSSTGKQKEISELLGEKFGTKMKEKYPNASPSDAITGIAKMDPEWIDELLFYGKEAHIDEGVCKFISNIWVGFINQFMPKPFKADEPMCKITSSGMCLYAFTPKK